MPMHPPMPLRLRAPPAYCPIPDPWPAGLRCWDTRPHAPGDCWYGTWDDGAWWTYAEADEHGYRGPRLRLAPEHCDARPMVVVLPTGDLHCLHSPTTRDGRPGPSGWSVQGELPQVTVQPSINSLGRWHGWVRDGVLVSC